MAANEGKLWQAHLRDGTTPVWLLEWELRQRLPRRVLVAVDTSDSCAKERNSLKDFFGALINVLELGDSCALWLIGRSKKAVEVTINRYQDRQPAVHSLSNALEDVRGGTWLAETFDEMIHEAATADATEAFCSCLIASDGEVFDADALPEPRKSRIGFVRLGSRASRQLQVMAQKTEAVFADELSLREFLDCPPLSISLAYGWNGERAVFFSAEGKIVEELPPVGPVPINSSDKLRVAFEGGEEPDLKLLYSAENLRWEETKVVSSAFSPHCGAHLRRILRELDGNRVDWDEEKLKWLVADCKKTGDSKKAELSCPVEETHGKHLARKSLFCWCDALLVSRDGIRREELPKSYSGKLCFPIRSENVDLREVFSCKWDTGNDAYAVHEVNGERWLALNLFKKA